MEMLRKLSGKSFTSAQVEDNNEESEKPLDLSKNNQEFNRIPLLHTQPSALFPNDPFSIKNVLQPIKTLDTTHNQQSQDLIGNFEFVPSISMQQIPLESTSSIIFRPFLRTRGKERSLLPCSVCGKKFDRPSLLKRHMRTHTGEKPHICDVCAKGFSTSSSLNTHRRIHSGEKPHECPICGKRFTASSNLYYHRMTHNKEKPHKCLICGKSFPTPGDLKSHQYIHSGTWPYTCPVCQRGFSKQTNLRNHVLLHSGDRPHRCDKCGKKFALACNLRAHLKTHDEGQPQPLNTKCPKCNESGVPKSKRNTCDSCIHEELFQSSRKMSPPINVKETHATCGIPDTTMSEFKFSNLGNERLYEDISTASRPNPFQLENLFAWNLQFGTNFLHQKFLESQLIAAAQNFNYQILQLPSSGPFPIIEQRNNSNWSVEMSNETRRN